MIFKIYILGVIFAATFLVLGLMNNPESTKTFKREFEDENPILLSICMLLCLILILSTSWLCAVEAIRKWVINKLEK